jgi:hypothetical protein
VNIKRLVAVPVIGEVQDAEVGTFGPHAFGDFEQMLGGPGKAIGCDARRHLFRQMSIRNPRRSLHGAGAPVPPRNPMSCVQRRQRRRPRGKGDHVLGLPTAAGNASSLLRNPRVFKPALGAALK